MSTQSKERQHFYEMWRDILSASDRREIFQTRAFPKNAWGSSELLADFYFSDSGIEAPLAQLTDEERIFLHKLASLGDPQKLDVLTPVYVENESGYTYTERFKDSYKDVMTRLVRKTRSRTL